MRFIIVELSSPKPQKEEIHLNSICLVILIQYWIIISDFFKFISQAYLSSQIRAQNQAFRVPIIRSLLSPILSFEVEML